MSPTTASPRTARLDRILSELEQLEQEQRMRDAARMVLLSRALACAVTDDGADGGELPYRSLRAELATALQRSEHVVEGELDAAERIISGYPTTHEALGAGEITADHARVISEAGGIIGPVSVSAADVDPAAPLSEEDLADPFPSAQVVAVRRARYEAAVLDFAREETAHRLRPIARRLAAQWSQASLTQLHREAARLRRVRVVEREDGMSDVIAHIPTLTAQAIRDRLDRITRELMRGPALETETLSPPDLGGDETAGSASAGSQPRSRDAVRADALCELLLRGDPPGLGTAPPGAAIHAHVQLIVPAGGDPAASGGAAAGSTPSPPCELVGAGPIDPRTAADAASRTRVWDRVTVNPVNGNVLRVDRYRPSAKQRRVLRARDLHCRFPGCTVPVARCDLDHTIDAALGGPTSTDNLAALCRGHHTLKHHGGWSASQDDQGVLGWRSPTGRTHTDRPPSRVRFRTASPTPPQAKASSPPRTTASSTPRTTAPPPGREPRGP